MTVSLHTHDTCKNTRILGGETPTSLMTSFDLRSIGLFWFVLKHKNLGPIFPFCVKNNIVVLFLFVDETGDCTPLTCGSTWCRGKKNIN